MIDVDPVIDFAELLRRTRRGTPDLQPPDELARAARGLLRHQRRASPQARLVRAAMGSREAMVKVVLRGGAKTAGQLRTQLDYLARQGDVALEASAAWGGGRLDPDEVLQTAAEWAEGWRGKTNYGHTRHFVVSFPADTAPEAAYKAGRDFAARVFGGGEFGDCWDHVTAFHTDRAHPHIHIVVNNRGVDNGLWLKTGRNDALSPDTLRRVQVEVAAEHGIEMTHTTRFERGLERRVTNAEHWRAARDRRRARPVARNRAAAAADRAVIHAAAGAYRRLSDFYRGSSDRIAGALAIAAETVARRRPLEPGATPLAPDPGTEAEIARVTEIASHAAQKLSGMETAAAKIQNPALREQTAARLGEAKASVARYAPDRPELAAYARPGGAGAKGHAALSRAVAGPGSAAKELRRKTEALGLDVSAITLRGPYAADASAGRVADWTARDAARIAETRGGDLARALASLKALHEGAERVLARHAQLRERSRGRDDGHEI